MIPMTNHMLSTNEYSSVITNNMAIEELQYYTEIAWVSKWT